MTDIAIFVEDPGAVAFIDGVPEALAKLGYTSKRVTTAYQALAMVVGTGEDAAWVAVLEAARRYNIPTIGLVDSITSVEHRFSGMRHRADWIAVPDEDTRQAYLAKGFDPKRVRACGHPRHDALYAMIRGVDFGLRPRPTIMFATELSTSRDPALGRDRRTEDAIERFLAAVDTLPVRPLLVLRLHPKTPSSLYSAYRERFDGQSAIIPASQAILAADVVVGLTSSILDEAVILGRPAISIAMPQERAALAGWRHGLVPAAFDPQDIAKALQRASPPSLAAVEAAFPRGGARKVAELINDAIMEQMPTLEGEGIRLEPFSTRHMTPRYLGWLNDPETVRYSEQRHLTHDIESCTSYREKLNSPHKFWAIIAPPFGHVGNVTATVDKHNRVADLAIMVGHRGRGIGRKAWKLALGWLLGPGGMRKVTAGTMADNAPMMGLIRNSGMSVEGRQSGRFLLDGVPVGAVFAAKER